MNPLKFYIYSFFINFILLILLNRIKTINNFMPPIKLFTIFCISLLSYLTTFFIVIGIIIKLCAIIILPKKIKTFIKYIEGE
jgi:hypothetical protein